MSFRRSLVPSPFSHLALTIALFSVVTANSQSSAGQPSRSCHKTMSCSTKSGPIRLQAPHAAPSHELKASAHRPSSQVTTGKAADSNVPTTSNPQLQERLGELSQRMQQHVEACRKAAQQAANDEQAAKTESSAIGQSIDKSRRLILLGRKLLAASGKTISLGGRELTPEQLGGVLATLIEEHQKLLEKEREARIEAAAAEAKRQGADEQLARWQQQQVELLRLIDSLVTADDPNSNTPTTADEPKLAEELASRLDLLLPPPAP